MKWQILAVIGFAAWLSFGAAVGAVLSPMLHSVPAEAFSARTTTIAQGEP